MEIHTNDILLREINRMHMNVLDMAESVLGKEWRCEKCRSSYSCIYYVREGKGEIRYGKKKISLLPGNIYIIPAELEFGYSCDDYLDKLFFHVNILRYNKYDLLSKHKECIILKNRQDDIENAFREWRNQGIASAVFLKSQLFRIVVEALEQENISLGEIEGYSDVVERCISFIDENLKATLTAEQIAGHLYVSAGALQKQFCREVGVTLGRYVTDRVMFEAERMLKVKGSTIKEISNSLGFCDQFYFSRCFLKRYGISPGKYRKEVIRL